jgi:diguanylate cyclase (GGDEF)-like protein
MDKPFVLIIEDEREVAAVFRHVLDLAGYRTEIVSNGGRALERLALALPDVVLLDLTLPEVSGPEILQHMRSDARFDQVPVVVITGYPQLAQTLAVEPDLLMIKPVSGDQLTRLVHRLGQEGGARKMLPFDKTPWDQVTGLYNRSFFVKRLEHALHNARESSDSLFAVLLVGPSQEEREGRRVTAKPSDEAMRQAAELLKSSIRPTDTIARFEGDHYFLLIESLSNAEIPKVIGRRLQEKLDRRPADALGQRFASSVGVILFDRRYHSVAEVQRAIRAAHASLFSKGPARYLVFEPDAAKNGSAPADGA